MDTFKVIKKNQSKDERDYDECLCDGSINKQSVKCMCIYRSIQAI